MKVGVVVPPSRETLEGLLEGLVRVNVALFRRSALPPLYRSGVRYQREAPGRERWQTAEQTFSKMRGDCEDLAAWRAAELRRAGEPAARCIVRRGGPRTWHVLVRREDGSIEDPSEALGM